MENGPKWLSELEGTVPEAAYGVSINVYIIAYEAWRRGLTVSFENVYSKTRGKYFTRYHIHDNEKSVKFNHNRGAIVPQNVQKITADKLKTRKALAEENFPVLESKIVSTVESDEIMKATENFRYPVMATMIDSADNRGYIAIAENHKELLKALENQKKKNKTDRFLLEEYIAGEHYHAYIVDDKVIGVYKKVPLYVTGDGVKSIKELLKASNIIRSEIPSLTNLSVNIDKSVKGELKNQNYTPDSIPEAGKVVRLKAIKDGSANEDVVDATDELPEDLKNNLVSAMKVFPGLIQGEVEVVYDKHTNRFAISRINTKAGIRNYLYPLRGQARPIPKAIIDYYFPETKDRYWSDTTPKYYFDYEIVNDQLRNNRLSKILLPEHRYEPNLMAKSIKFQSDYNINKLKKIIRKNFIKLKFDGEFNVLDNKQYELILAGNYQDIAYFIDYLASKNYLQNVISGDYKSGIRTGYAFNDLRLEKSSFVSNTEDTQKQKIDGNSKEAMKYKKTIQEKQGRISELEQEIADLKNSKSWTMTSPIRKIRKRLGR